MSQKAPGKAFRKGMSMMDLFRMFPNEETAEAWFVQQRWGDEVACVRCGSCNVNTKAKHPAMPFRCRDCDKRFSVKLGTVMESSNLGYQVWAIAMYLMSTNIKGVSAMKLHRDLATGYKAAWFLAHRIRESFNESPDWIKLSGPVEVDETYIGGKEANKHASKKTFNRGTQGKATVMGAKQRDGKVYARPLGWEPGEKLANFVHETVQAGETVYTDDHRAYKSLREVFMHHTVKHSVGEYVDGMAHTNGIESFWAMLKRGYHGVYHKMSVKHLARYVNEFTGRHNVRPLDTVEQMERLAQGMEGKRLRYKDLIA